MAAQQAADVADEEVIVIPSKTVPQGMTALLAFNPSAGLKANEDTMVEALKHVKTGQITFAVRDTSIEGLSIEKDDFMGINEGKIVVKNKNKLEAAKELLENMLDEDSEILTILQGEETNDQEVEALVSFIEEKFEDLEIEIHKGQQPLYSFIFAIE
jgi:uncharacterized protein